MRKFLVSTVAALAISASAQAACPNVVSGISVLEGGSPIHVTVVNPATCANVPPAALSLSGGSCPTNAVGPVAASPTKLSYTSDATGLSFQSVAGATGMGTCNMTLSYTDGSNVVTTVFTFTLSSGVSSIVVTSP